jgi:hypothetical protein
MGCLQRCSLACLIASQYRHCRSVRACSGAGPARPVCCWIASSAVQGGLSTGMLDLITVCCLLGWGVVCVGSPVANDSVGQGIHLAGRGQPASLAKDSNELAWAYSRRLRADSGQQAVQVGPSAGSVRCCAGSGHCSQAAVGLPARPVYGSFPAAVGCGGGLKPSATRWTRTPRARRPAGR